MSKTTDETEASPLADACVEGDLPRVKSLFDAASLEVRRGGRTLVHIAAQNGHAELTRWLLEQGASLITVDDHGNTPLVNYVRKHPDVEIARLILDSGVKIDHPNDDGWTALGFACHWDSRWNELVALLLDRGADPNCRTIEGWTPFLLACHQRIVVGGPESVVLARPGLDVNVAGAVFGFTPLMMAVRGMPLPVVEALVARGADPDARMTIQGGKKPRPKASILARNIYSKLRVADTFDGFNARDWGARGARRKQIAAILGAAP